MLIACEKGHLSVCEWLYEVGAAEDITKASNNDGLPCRHRLLHGHLSVCKWLFEVGAAKDIIKVARTSGTLPCASPARVATCRCASG